MIENTKRTSGIEYAIRDVILPARKLEKQGKDILRLNIGDPLKYDFETPKHMREGAKEAIDDGKNFYGTSEGEKKLRKAIARRENERNNANLDYSDVLVTNGISEGINLLFAALLEKGDEILVPGPTYPPYIALSEFYGAEPVNYRTIEEEGWKPDVEDLRDKITEDTRAIVVINPNNPTGALYPKETLREIAEVAGEYNIPLISDEVYDDMTYEGEHVGTAEVSGEVPLITFNGFSKVYLAPGWRTGYMCFNDPKGELSNVKEGVEKMTRLRLSSNTPVQYGALEGITQEKTYLKEVMCRLEERRDLFHKRINEIEGLSSAKPQGAFYIFPKIESDNWDSDKQFVLDVLNEIHVLFVHGSGFDPKFGDGHFRSVFLPRKEVIGKALNRLDSFMRKHG